MLTGMNFLSKTSLKILHFLASSPMQEFYGREIAKKAKISVGAASQALNELAKKQVVAKYKRGKMVFYRLNLSNPMVRQVKVFLTVMSLSDLMDKIKEHSKKVVLFGSCAEGTDTEASDIDLFVLTNEKNKVKREIKSSAVKKKITPIIVNAVEFSKLKIESKALYESVSKGIVLWRESHEL
jgi:predicted nucleotidyltransferase